MMPAWGADSTFSPRCNDATDAEAVAALLVTANNTNTNSLVPTPPTSPSPTTTTTTTTPESQMVDLQADSTAELHYKSQGNSKRVLIAMCIGIKEVVDDEEEDRHLGDVSREPYSKMEKKLCKEFTPCLLYTSPSPRDS